MIETFPAGGAGEARQLTKLDHDKYAVMIEEGQDLVLDLSNFRDCRDNVCVVGDGIFNIRLDLTEYDGPNRRRPKIETIANLEKVSTLISDLKPGNHTLTLGVSRDDFGLHKHHFTLSVSVTPSRNNLFSRWLKGNK